DLPLEGLRVTGESIDIAAVARQEGVEGVEEFFAHTGRQFARVFDGVDDATKQVADADRFAKLFGESLDRQREGPRDAREDFDTCAEVFGGAHEICSVLRTRAPTRAPDR